MGARTDPQLFTEKDCRGPHMRSAAVFSGGSGMGTETSTKLHEISLHCRACACPRTRQTVAGSQICRPRSGSWKTEDSYTGDCVRCNVGSSPDFCIDTHTRLWSQPTLLRVPKLATNTLHASISFGEKHQATVVILYGSGCLLLNLSGSGPRGPEADRSRTRSYSLP